MHHRFHALRLLSAALMFIFVASIGLISSAQSDDRAQAAALLAEGQKLLAQRTPDSLHKAVDTYTQALSLATKNADNGGQFISLLGLAWAHLYLQEATQGLTVLNQAQELAQKTGDRAAQAVVLGMFGTVHDSMAEEDKALEYFAQSRTIWQQLGNKSNEAQILQSEGTAYQRKGDLPHAIQSFEQAVALFHAVQDARGEINALVRIGQLNNLLKGPENLAKSVASFKQALPLAQSSGDRFNEGYAWWGLGDSYYWLGQKPEAVESYRKALPIIASLNGGSAAPRVLLALCQTEDASTDSKQAVEDCTRALTGLKPSGSKLDIFSAEMHLGAAYEALGDRSQALQAYEDAVVATQTAGDTAMQSTAYLKIGTLHFNAGEWQPAIKADTQALEIARARADAPGQVAALMALSSCYQSIGNFKKSLDYSLQALRLNKNETSELKRETVLMSVGDSYNWLGETQKALDYLNQALILAEKYPEQKGLLLAEVGEIYSAIGDQKTALEKEQQAFDLYHSVSNPGGEAKALNDMGLIYAALGEEPQARDSYQKALVIQRERKNVGAQSTLLMNLGDLAQYFGNGKDAEKLYSDSLTLSRQIGLRSQEADALTKLGMVYHALGDEPKALETLNQALAIYRETENRHGEAFALGDLAVFYSDTGNPQRSLESLGHVLAIYRELGDPPNEATTLDNLGSAYQTLGDYDQAQQYVQQALEIRERIHEESGQSVSLNDLAVLAQLRKDTPAALRYFDQSLALAKKTGNKLGQSRLLANEGAIYSEQGNQQRALDIFELSLKLAHEVDYLDSEAQALHNRGRAKFDSGDARGALEDYRQALALWRQLNRVDGEAQTSSAAARAERKLGNLDAALRDVNESIRLSESARGRIASKTLRASYLATVANYYELAIDLLIQLDRLHPGQGYDAQALEMSEQSRARSLLDLLTQAHADNIRAGVDPGLVSEERAIENSIKAKNTERAKLLDAFSRTADTSAQAQHLELEIENLIAEYQHLEDRIKASNPAYAALTDPEPLKVKQIQQLLDPDTLLLEYSLGKDRSFLWLVTQNSFTAHELPKREEIEEQAGNYHYLLTNKIPNPTALRKAEQYLSSVLLGPVAPQLDGKRLVFVADGMLQEIPFAALPSPLDTGLPLVAEHEIVSEPSASALAVLRRETTGRTLAPKIAAVLADPVFEPTDERLTGASAKQDPSVNRAVLNTAAQQSGLRGADNIKRLPYTRQEAAEILKISPPDQSIALLDFKATKSFVQTADLTQYRIVHFATHGLLDSQHPELSGLVLSRFDEKGQPLDGFLALEDIFNLKLPAQLVVLSACQSGEGKLIGGEGLVGLTRGFMYAGASTLNVSLWNVDDAATAQLMAHFYGGLLGSQHLKPAAALRTAQLALMKHNEWKHPYFWAPFVIQGEWR